MTKRIFIGNKLYSDKDTKTHRVRAGSCEFAVEINNQYLETPFWESMPVQTLVRQYAKNTFLLTESCTEFVLVNR